jgi:5-methylcytosine-specific restriction endonuclease McrA
MTRRRAEQLTGYEIRPLQLNEPGYRFGAFAGDELIAERSHADERLALKRLVDTLYAIHCAIVLERHRWQCVRCGCSWCLEIHHRTFRSHGGTHRPENLEPVCRECHGRIHRYERSI